MNQVPIWEVAILWGSRHKIPINIFRAQTIWTLLYPGKNRVSMSLSPLLFSQGNVWREDVVCSTVTSVPHSRLAESAAASHCRHHRFLPPLASSAGAHTRGHLGRMSIPFACSEVASFFIRSSDAKMSEFGIGIPRRP